MIQKIKIENFKSIPSLEMELGRVNVFIGENGCGKTNILEAFALASAAITDKLEPEFLYSRGVRQTDNNFLFSGFSKTNQNEQNPINLNIKGENKVYFNIELSEDTSNRLSFLHYKMAGTFPDGKERLLDWNFFPFNRFLIFTPENYFLRRFEEETQIRPLGIRGEGLFQHLAFLSQNEPETIEKINEQLRLIDWFDGFEMPNDLMFSERRIRIKDRFLENGIGYIDQRSSNEGFLYLLFYITLFISKYTPKIFAIDNIDNALNPKLCGKLIEILVKLAKENDKQVILTAHNPGLLDGIDLNDDDQRLFVISRNKIGHTNALRIEHKPSSNGNTDLKLSEQFLRGYIGGLPKSF
jgi:predicted ATPase